MKARRVIHILCKDQPRLKLQGKSERIGGKFMELPSSHFRNIADFGIHRVSKCYGTPSHLFGTHGGCRNYLYNICLLSFCLLLVLCVARRSLLVQSCSCASTARSTWRTSEKTTFLSRLGPTELPAAMWAHRAEMQRLSREIHRLLMISHLS